VSTIRWHRMERDSLSDGPGKRAVLWLVGCDRHCDGCQNPDLWDVGPSTQTTHADTLGMILSHMAHDQSITITGGEPLQQVAALGELLQSFREMGDEYGQLMRTVVVYTGYTWEELDKTDPAVLAALSEIHFLVDGPYIAEQDDDWIQYRGSRNQRVINVPASLRTGQVVEHPSWDDPTLKRDKDGLWHGPKGLIRALFPDQFFAQSKMCGERSTDTTERE